MMTHQRHTSPIWLLSSVWEKSAQSCSKQSCVSGFRDISDVWRPCRWCWIIRMKYTSCVSHFLCHYLFSLSYNYFYIYDRHAVSGWTYFLFLNEDCIYYLVIFILFVFFALKRPDLILKHSNNFNNQYLN